MRQFSEVEDSEDDTTSIIKESLTESKFFPLHWILK